MSTSSPVPPGGKGAAAAAAAAPGDADWRAGVNQSYRNTEVREISKILAALEPGATTASKLRLAMQFEDTVFKSATSLADYRKILTKRLKKLQKNYKPPAVAAPQPGDDASNLEAVLKELRQTYGEALQYILKHADTAVEEMRKRHGDEKAVQLKQHTDSVQGWAADLGVVEGKPVNLTMSTEHLEKLKGHLERRTENIRSHVVKLADPDQFMAETLAKREQEFFSPENSTTRPSRILAECTRRRYEHMNQQMSKDKSMHADKLLADALEAALRPVPLPTRGNTQQSDERAALIHLEKMRSASTVLLAYMGLADKTSIAKSQVVSKAHNVAREGIDFVIKVMKVHRDRTQEPTVCLEDAWMKPLVLSETSTDGGVNDASTNTGDANASPRKRPRLPSGRPVVRSRVLLTANRKTPYNLLAALRRKRARLVRPPPRGDGSHLILEFGQAFVMTIYFVPLVVTLRAATPAGASEAEQARPNEDYECAAWTPLHHGLNHKTDLTVWGATGDYAALGFVVEERLRDASVHATAVLRQCFAAASKASTEFETEILEATALLEFLQVARTTYMPDWQDDDSG